MELVGFSALPYCLLLLAVFSTQQFRCWPAHVPITEREGGLFRHYCFGSAHRYVLCALAYFAFNAAFYLTLFTLAWLSGIASNATVPWLLLVVAIVLPALPGLNRPLNWLRYQLQRYAFRPALPSPTEAQVWRQLCRDGPVSVMRSAQQEDMIASDPGARFARNWEHLLFLCGLLQRVIENNPRHKRHSELTELTGFVSHKTSALQQRGVHNAEWLELLLGCCYLAIARLVVHEFHSDSERRARLWELGLPVR